MKRDINVFYGLSIIFFYKAMQSLLHTQISEKWYLYIIMGFVCMIIDIAITDKK